MYPKTRIDFFFWMACQRHHGSFESVVEQAKLFGGKTRPSVEAHYEFGAWMPDFKEQAPLCQELASNIQNGERQGRSIARAHVLGEPVPVLDDEVHQVACQRELTWPENAEANHLITPGIESVQTC